MKYNGEAVISFAVVLCLQGLFRGGAVKQKFVVAEAAVVAVEGGEGVGGLFQHLFGHRD